MIDFSGAQPAWPREALELWAACVHDAAREEHLWRVPAPGGDEELRSWLGHHFTTEPAGITIVAGARAAALTYGRIAERLLVEAPTYLGLLPFLGAYGRRVEHFAWERIPVPVPERTVLLVTSPARNPDGATLTGDHRARLRTLVSAGGRVVVNGTYCWFRPDAATAEGADLLVSFHKLAGVGARLGFVRSEAYFSDAVPEIAGAAPPPIWQRAWARFLARDGHEHLLRVNVRQVIDSRDAFLWTIGELAPALRPGAVDGPNLLFSLPDGADEQEAVTKLETDGFRVSAGSAFAAPHPSLRLTFTGTTPDQAANLAQTLVRDRLCSGSL